MISLPAGQPQLDLQLPANCEHVAFQQSQWSSAAVEDQISRCSCNLSISWNVDWAKVKMQK